VKFSKAQVRKPVHAIPTIQFENKQLTSFGGAVLLQALFQGLNLRQRLCSAFREGATGSYGLDTVFYLLVTQLMLGLTRLRDCDAYRHDPLLKRVLGLRQLPDVSTISRTLSQAASPMFDAVRKLIRALVLERLRLSALLRVTLDFDGSVQSMKRKAEGSAVGFNKAHKGQRSYYPLFCTIPQLGMFFDFHHRSGNVHDSNGADHFIRACVGHIKSALKSVVVLEARLDSAFFQEKLLDSLAQLGVEFSASVPFERFAKLKKIVQTTSDWQRINDLWSFSEISWRPHCWAKSCDYRIILYRRRSVVQRKGPLQLDLFEPRDTEFEYKVVVSNKKIGAAALLTFHNGRGVQEAMFGEAKNGAGLEYVPSRRLIGNQLFCAAATLAHNLGRDMMWQTAAKSPETTPNRAPSIPLRSLESLQKHLFHRAGRLTNPQGNVVLTISANLRTQREIENAMSMLRPAA